MAKRTIRDLRSDELRGRRALVRVDFNVPLDGERITDDTRIRAAIPSIKLLLAGGARVVLLSHLGRPKAKVDPKYSLAPVARHLAKLLNQPVHFCAETDSDTAVAATRSLEDGDVLTILPAVAGGVATAALLAAKASLHAWLQRPSWPELRSGLVLLVMSFILLPALPKIALRKSKSWTLKS